MAKTKKEIFMEQMALGINTITYYPSTGGGLTTYLHGGRTPHTVTNPQVSKTTPRTFTLKLTSNTHLAKGQFSDIVSINNITL